ncbi:MAG: helix-turn-helix transcriptional regulator [Bilophila wadsworthia]
MTPTSIHSTCTCRFFHQGQCSCPDVTLFVIDDDSHAAGPFRLQQDGARMTFFYCLNGQARIDAQAADGEAFSEEIGKKQPAFLPERRLFHLTRREADSGRGAPAPSGMPAPVCLPARFCPRWAQESSSRTLKGDIPLHLRILLEQILNCRDDGLLRDVFLAHKKYELLYQQIELLDRENSHKCVSPAECRAAHRAYAILLQDIGKPPSLPELAAAVGVNRTRLTALFRMLFEDTVFGILRRERLECARRLLNEKGKNITEIAYLCGFSSPSHLTKAFSAQFGISPKQYQIARRHGHPAASVSCGEQHT